MMLQTQWRYSITGQRSGLVYQSIPVVCDAMDIPYSADLLSRIQLLESKLIQETT